MKINEVLTESNTQLPSYEEVVTGKWINEIVRTGRWSEHGSKIDGYLEDHNKTKT